MKKVRKSSKKRRAILELLRSTDRHPGADWIYTRLRGEFPDLSLGTVYRNLSMLREDGEIAGIGSVSGQERFDGNTTPHSHFVCERCGGISDVGFQAIAQNAYSEIRRETRHIATSHSLIFFGVCNQCQV